MFITCNTCLKLQKCLEHLGDFPQVHWSAVFQWNVLKYDSCAQTQHKWRFAQLKKCPEFRNYIKYTCASSIKQGMVLSGIRPWCQYTWQHKRAICKLHFWMLSAGVSVALFHHILQQDLQFTTFLKSCVWAQFCFTSRCVMRKKLFRTNRYVLVLFISDVKLASRSIFQTFVHLRARVSYLCLFLTTSLWRSDSKWPMLLHERWSPNTPLW